MFPCCKLVSVPKPVLVQLPRKKSSRSYQCVSLHYCSFKQPTAFYSCRNQRILSCCVMRLWHIHIHVSGVCAMLVDLLSWVFIKQVRSTAADNFSLLLNGPTHNSSIFLLCQAAARHITARRKRKGQNSRPWPNRSLQKTATFRCFFSGCIYLIAAPLF